MFQAARDRLRAAVAAEGYKVLPAEGTYFLSIDLAAAEKGGFIRTTLGWTSASR